MSFTAQTTLLKYLAKLERHVALPPREKDAFLSLPYQKESFEARRTIVRDGSQISSCIFVGSGLTSRVKILANDTKQIVAFNIPGDAPDLQGLLLRVADHNICTHTHTQIVRVEHSDIRALTINYPILAEALWLDTLIEASILREWTVNVGQRRATARIAHLFLEMEARFGTSGSPGSYVLPLSQGELAQALALSLVHLNKSLAQLKAARLVEHQAGVVKILNREAMLKLSGFDSGYLHLASSDVDANDPIGNVLTVPGPIPKFSP